MNEGKNDDRKIEVEEYKVARYPPPDPEEKGGHRVLRGCGIALGIAALVFLFAVGACFMAFA